MTPSRRQVLGAIGGTITVGTTGCLEALQSGPPGELTVEWVAGESLIYGTNHHDAATATVDGKPIIAVPQNDVAESSHCGIVAYDETGTRIWRQSLDPGQCNAHAIGDVGVGDLTGDGRPAFLALREPGVVVAYDAETGENVYQQKLPDAIGYTAPIVHDGRSGDPASLYVVGLEGSFAVLTMDGIETTLEFESPVFDTPVVGDVTGDGGTNVVLNHDRFPSSTICLDHDMNLVWETEQERTAQSVQFVRRDGKPAIATTDMSTVRLLDGPTGDVQWERTVGDGLRELFIGPTVGDVMITSAPDGTVRALNVATGDVEWESTLTERGEQPMTAPTAGHVSEQDSASVVATGHDGTVAVFDSSGEVLARKELDPNLYIRPHIADVTGDGLDDIILYYGDARVGALTYDEV